MFTVWQPMIATDWRSPITSVLARMSDRRVQQYWDPDHVVAKRMAADARPPQPAQECCEKNGILWDLAAVYPRGVRWDASLPPAVLFNGTVADVAEEIDAAVRKLR